MSKESQDTKYAPDNLPRKITRKLYVYYRITGYFAGQINVWDFHNKNDSEMVLLCEAEATILIPAIDRKGLKSRALVVLEAEKQRILAESHQQLKKVQDKIDQLLAIEYKPGDAA